jgi:prepilin-type N-terminal cleavage/methylation domain-containing protein
MRARRGYSFVELLTVISVLGILAALAVPRYRNLKTRAIAAQAVGDFSAVRVASFNYFADKGAYPPDAGPGITPPELVPYLPQTFEFDQESYDLDYDSYTVSSGSGSTHVLAITVRSGDPTIVQHIARSISGGAVGLVVGSAFTYVITGL